MENPFRPGAGHRPPVLAGRGREQEHFRRLLREDFATENLLITGLRGFGKTVLLDDLKRTALAEGWVWVGNDLSESASLSEDRLALRILTDLAQSLSEILVQGADGQTATSKHAQDEAKDDLDPTTFEALKTKYERTPGLPSDKLKSVLGRVGSILTRAKLRGLVLAYDEAQCLSDHAQRDEFPMSMLVETVSSLQKRDGVTPILLVLSGLPQVFNALIAARTYTERMFHVMQMERLSRQDTAQALFSPMKPLMPPLNCPPDLFEKVVDLSGGYPYLIQFFGKELIDGLLKNGGILHKDQFPSPDVMDRLDAGLFAARWNKTTDKQRRFLKLIANRGTNRPNEFSAIEIAALSNGSGEFDSSQANQLLLALCERGLIYRTRHGRYAFTVPMSEAMILRRIQVEQDVESSWATISPPPIPIAPLTPEAPPPPKTKQKHKSNGLLGWFN